MCDHRDRDFTAILRLRAAEGIKRRCIRALRKRSIFGRFVNDVRGEELIEHLVLLLFGEELPGGPGFLAKRPERLAGFRSEFANLDLGVEARELLAEGPLDRLGYEHGHDLRDAAL